MIKILRSQIGFTFIELLVVMTIFALMLLVVNQALFSSFRGSSKSEATQRAKQEGERVMAIIERSVHNSRSIISCSPTQITYKDQFGIDTSFSCQNIGSGSGRIASGSAVMTSNDVDVSVCSISCETVGGATKAVLFNTTFVYKSGAVVARAEEKGSVTMQTRVLLRN